MSDIYQWNINQLSVTKVIQRNECEAFNDSIRLSVHFLGPSHSTSQQKLHQPPTKHSSNHPLDVYHHHPGTTCCKANITLDNFSLPSPPSFSFSFSPTRTFSFLNSSLFQRKRLLLHLLPHKFINCFQWNVIWILILQSPENSFKDNVDRNRSLVRTMKSDQTNSQSTLFPFFLLSIPTETTPVQPAAAAQLCFIASRHSQNISSGDRQSLTCSQTGRPGDLGLQHFPRFLILCHSVHGDTWRAFWYQTTNHRRAGSWWGSMECFGWWSTSKHIPHKCSISRTKAESIIGIPCHVAYPPAHWPPNYHKSVVGSRWKVDKLPPTCILTIIVMVWIFYSLRRACNWWVGERGSPRLMVEETKHN